MVNSKYAFIAGLILGAATLLAAEKIAYSKAETEEILTPRELVNQFNEIYLGTRELMGLMNELRSSEIHGKSMAMISREYVERWNGNKNFESYLPYAMPNALTDLGVFVMDYAIKELANKRDLTTDDKKFLTELETAKKEFMEIEPID